MITKNNTKKIQILFTHDMHSHLDPDKKEQKEQFIKTGGFAKLKTMADQKRTTNYPSVLLDGGDFSMGTLYQTIYETEAPELVLMGEMGYDAVTLGNHEFDYRSEGVSHMLLSAVRQKEQHSVQKLPALLLSNIDWGKNTTPENRKLKQALDTYGSSSYTILEKEGIRIGIFGVLGKDADAFAPESGLIFDTIVESSRKMIKVLQKEQADLIICLSHSGTCEKESKSEDEILAKAVPEIDVIVSGHSHTILRSAISYGDTYIVSAGSYCELLGELELSQKENGRWILDSYHLHSLDETVEENPEIKEKLKEYKKKVDQNYLSRFGCRFDEIIAHNSVDFTPINDFAKELEEDPLGSLIADSYVYAVQKAEGDSYEKVDVTVLPAGSIRSTFQKGPVTISDVFNVSSLGIGPDRIPGYPLVGVYLAGKELKTIAEIDVSISALMPTAQLYASGLQWTFNPHRLLLNRVTHVTLSSHVPDSSQYQEEEIKDDKLYRVVSGLYSAQMLSTVKTTSKGILEITPKDKQGRKVENFEDYIIYNPNGTEVKEWFALASYLKSFSESEGKMAEIPSYYGNPEGRKEKHDSLNPIEIFKHPNKVACAVYGICTGTVVAAAGFIRWVWKRWKR